MSINILVRCVFLLCSIFYTLVASEVSEDIQKIIEKADLGINEVNQAATEEITKIQTKAVKDLQRLLSKSRKADAASLALIQNQIDELQAKIDAVTIINHEILDGQTLAFLGDSITQQGWSNQNGYVKLVVAGLAANGITVKPIPAGISGHKSNDMLARLDADVISKKPDWMTLSCGVNDVWHGVNGVQIDQYKENITAIIDKAQAAGIKVMLLTATVIGEDLPNAKNVTLIEYNDFLRTIAKERKLALADLNADMQVAIKLANTPATKMLTTDGVHMNEAGNLLMAQSILRTFGFNQQMLDKAAAHKP